MSKDIPAFRYRPPPFVIREPPKIAVVLSRPAPSIESLVLAAFKNGAKTNAAIRDWMATHGHGDFTSQQIYYALQRLRKAGLARKVDGRWTKINKTT